MSDNYVVTKIVPDYTANIDTETDGSVTFSLEYEDQTITVTCQKRRVIDSMVVLENFAGVVIDEYAKRSADDNPPSNL